MLIYVAVFSLFPVQATLGQGLFKGRSQEETRQNTQSKEMTQSDGNAATIPWNFLDERSKKLVREVVDGKTFMRRMPQQVGYCDPEMYDYMINHPDVVIELWELLGVTNLSLKETGRNMYELKEGTATTSQVEILYKSDNLCIVYALGEYEAPVLRRKIKGDVVVVLKSRFGQDKENRLVVQSDLDTYVRIHNPGAEMLAKMLVPVVGKIADNNFEQTVGFVMNISEAAQENFESLVELAQRMKNVRPEVAQEFALVAESVFDRDVDRYIARASATESPVMSKYASQSTQDVRIQEQNIPSQNLRLSAPPTPPATTSDSMDERFIPLITSEMWRDIPQNHDGLTPNSAFDADESPGDVSLDALMRSLQEPMEWSANANMSENTSPRDALTPPPRTLTIVNDGRSVQRGETSVPEHLTTLMPPEKSTQPAQRPPANSSRVVIRTITPTTSPVIARETTDQQTSQTAPTVPSPTRFGTTSPVIPQQSGTKSSQSNGNRERNEVK